MKYLSFDALKGCTLEKIDGAFARSKEVIFTTTTGERYSMRHFQDCCETVEVEDVIGDVTDLIGSPILEAEEVSSSKGNEPREGNSESWTWTFYKIGTIKGHVTIRWLGESNGYYAEDVSFAKIAQTNLTASHLSA